MSGFLTANQPLLATLFGLAALLVLILRFRMPPFIGLILISIFSATAAGLAPDAAYQTIINGVGGTLGFIAVVIGLGAIFGVLLEASGAVGTIASTLLRGDGAGRARWAMGAVGLIAAIPVFFDVALIILAPTVFAMARAARKPALYFGLPLLAGLATAHAFIPPTPGPMAIAEIIGAELGLIILFGVIIGAISMIIAGPVLTGLLHRARLLGEDLLPQPTEQADHLGTGHLGAGTAIGLILMPLGVIVAGTLADLLLTPGPAHTLLTLIGHPFFALIAACGAATIAIRPQTDAQKDRVRGALARALEPAGAVILVTGAGGAFKQVLVDTGAGAQLAQLTTAVGFTPLVAGYVLAVIIRVAQGSATVAMITAAGLTSALIDPTLLSAPQIALVGIAIAAGASALSHVNDSGFWLVSRIFKVSEAVTLKTWSLSTTVLSIVGFIAAWAIFAIV